MFIDYNTGDVAPLDPDELQQALETPDLHFYGVDRFYLERTGVLRLMPGDIDLSELVCGVDEDKRPQAAARALRLMQAPAAERLRMASALEEALMTNLQILDVVEQVAGSEQQQTYSDMRENLFGEADSRSPETEFIMDFTMFPTPALYAYLKRLRSGTIAAANDVTL